MSQTLQIMEMGERIADLEKQLTYAKNIIKDLLDNSDEYCRQRAFDFIKE